MTRFVKKLGGLLLKLWVLFILVEVLWMLLPFAGFLYGSVFHIKYLNRNPQTAWLAHFVFPVHTLFPLGIVLMSVGFIVFLIGAGQIYAAKFRRTGLVTSGLYRKVRHPQYIALVLFGVGTLLTWGRFITFIAFFVMMFLYYRLACSEERNCERAFGQAYEEYKKKTFLLFPGEGWLSKAWRRMPRLGLPGWISVPLNLVAVVGLALAFGVFIQSVKVQWQKVPFITAEISSPQETAQVVIPFVESEGRRLVLVQGPLTLAQRMSYAKGLLRHVAHSKTLQEKLNCLQYPGEDRVIILVGSAGGPPEKIPAENAVVELFLVRIKPSDRNVDTLTLLTNPHKSAFVSAFVATLDPGIPAIPQGRDAVISCEDHPPPGIAPRWTNMLEMVKGRVAGLEGDVGKGPRKLILVQAPLYRARDKSFADQIMDRLLRSEAVRGLLARYQIGGNVVAVAFPRPGPNWYREHHGVPQIGAFVMLVRKKEPITDKELFNHSLKDKRKLEAAFIVEMDFAIPPEKDPVYEDPFIVGPLRELEERWAFFLSGVK